MIVLEWMGWMFLCCLKLRKDIFLKIFFVSWISESISTEKGTGLFSPALCIDSRNVIKAFCYGLQKLFCRLPKRSTEHFLWDIAGELHWDIVKGITKCWGKNGLGLFHYTVYTIHYIPRYIFVSLNQYRCPNIGPKFFWIRFLKSP